MRKLFAAAALLLAMLIPAGSAAAAPHSPTGDFAVFNDCPLSHPTVVVCMYSETTSGYVKTGSKTTPIKKPVVLQGGLEVNEKGEIVFAGAEDGNTLTKAPQPVPGGLLGITPPSWWPSLLKSLFEETINNGFTGVTATMELAGPASSIKVNSEALASGTGVELSMPVKIKLDNPFFGSNCYIGSNSNPIRLNLTAGTTSPPPPNTPISGSPGTPSENASGTVVTLTGHKLVDNSFAVPGANGCGGILFSWAVDPVVNSTIGIPSPAGTNAAVLEGRLLLGEPTAIRASEP
jgi:hypothetical protein